MQLVLCLILMACLGSIPGYSIERAVALTVPYRRHNSQHTNKGSTKYQGQISNPVSYCLELIDLPLRHNLQVTITWSGNFLEKLIQLSPSSLLFAQAWKSPHQSPIMPLHPYSMGPPSIFSTKSLVTKSDQFCEDFHQPVSS
jgi:hypothetical protein